jgi:hypothetical protein
VGFVDAQPYLDHDEALKLSMEDAKHSNTNSDDGVPQKKYIVDQQP